MMIVGAAGLTLVSIAMLQKAGLEINEDLVMIGLEVSKYGMILWLMKKFWVVFL
jgi:hypothetical protein